MKLEQAFEVKAPIEQVWEALIDVERVAPCLPGAEITAAADDGTYSGNFQVKLGPTTAAYSGKLSMESLDESARRATMKASGRDKRGQGSANATIVSTMTETAGGTRVEVETDFTITGRLARFGRGGMMQDISNRLLHDFANCLREDLEAGAAGAAAPAPPASGDSASAPSEPAVEAVPAPTAGRPPTASPGPAPAATGEAGTPAPPAAEPSGGPGTPAPPATGRQPAPAPTARPRPPRAPAKPVQGLSLFLSVLVERLKRLLGRRGT